MPKGIKSVCNFDDPNLSQTENLLFGNDNSDALHFNETAASLLKKILRYSCARLHISSVQYSAPPWSAPSSRSDILRPDSLLSAEF